MLLLLLQSWLLFFFYVYGCVLFIARDASVGLLSSGYVRIHDTGCAKSFNVRIQLDISGFCDSLYVYWRMGTITGSTSQGAASSSSSPWRCVSSLYTHELMAESVCVPLMIALGPGFGDVLDF